MIRLEKPENQLPDFRQLTDGSAQTAKVIRRPSLTWEKWCRKNINTDRTGKPRSQRDIRELMAMASADDPEKAREEEKHSTKTHEQVQSREPVGVAHQNDLDD